MSVTTHLRKRKSSGSGFTTLQELAGRQQRPAGLSYAKAVKIYRELLPGPPAGRILFLDGLPVSESDQLMSAADIRQARSPR